VGDPEDQSERGREQYDRGGEDPDFVGLERRIEKILELGVDMRDVDGPEAGHAMLK
jgi:hypothetical protein